MLPAAAVGEVGVHAGGNLERTGASMKLVTYDDGRVGRVEGDRVIALDVPTMREYFERGGDVRPTGEEVALADVTLRAPIVPQKVFHTAGNFREHHEESTRVNWSHPVLPWIVFLQT